MGWRAGDEFLVGRVGGQPTARWFKRCPLDQTERTQEHESKQKNKELK